MKRFALLLSLTALVAACDSSTDPGEVSLVGRWDGVGALQSSSDGYGIILYVESHVGGDDGTISGRWTKSGGRQGSIATGAVQSGEISFQLSGFPGDDPNFNVRLTHEHRMAGDVSGIDLAGEVVFRRGSVTP